MTFEPSVLAKRLLRRLLSEQTMGMIDYVRWPDRRASWGPFNGQTVRQALFVDIVAKTRPEAIVETGTFLGVTTELMSESGLPVFSIESNPRNYGFARARLWRRRNVQLLYTDSRTGLLMLFDGALRSQRSDTILFYLDAHWSDDLPLAEEFEIVFSHCSAAAVMIDDFQVPFDAGYGYDDYGPGKALVPSYIAPAVLAYGLRAFYPLTPSTDETGARRGCVVLANHSALISALSSLPLLCNDSSAVR